MVSIHIKYMTMCLLKYRWRIVIHAGIDDYSRMPVYCSCSDNNWATTVLSLLIHAVQRFGLPSRIRTDKGGENVDVVMYMLQHRGCGRASAIVGRSVHNQRIERFWRDLFQGCIVLFYDLFHDMERIGILDASNDTLLFCLQYVYNPRINQALQFFVDSWCHHRIRTAHGLSPLQLFLSG